jgi:fluoride exporter
MVSGVKQPLAGERTDVFRARAARRVRRHRDVLAAIALGGGLGSLARYLIAQALPHRPETFPWATFLTNVVGCAALGALMLYVTQVWPPRRYVRPFWGVGFLGGFTTFSTYTLELRGLLDHGAWAVAAGYGLGSLAAGLAAVWAGAAAARYASGRALRRRRAERAEEAA